MASEDLEAGGEGEGDKENRAVLACCQPLHGAEVRESETSSEFICHLPSEVADEQSFAEVKANMGSHKTHSSMSGLPRSVFLRFTHISAIAEQCLRKEDIAVGYSHTSLGCQPPRLPAVTPSLTTRVGVCGQQPEEKRWCPA